MDSKYYLTLRLPNGDSKRFVKYYVTEDDYINVFNNDAGKVISFLFSFYKDDNKDTNLEPKNFFLKKFSQY